LVSFATTSLAAVGSFAALFHGCYEWADDVLSFSLAGATVAEAWLVCLPLADGALEGIETGAEIVASAAGFATTWFAKNRNYNIAFMTCIVDGVGTLTAISCTGIHLSHLLEHHEEHGSGVYGESGHGTGGKGAADHGNGSSEKKEDAGILHDT